MSPVSRANGVTQAVLGLDCLEDSASKSYAVLKKRLARGSAKLRLEDWKCGDRLWGIKIIAMQLGLASNETKPPAAQTSRRGAI